MAFRMKFEKMIKIMMSSESSDPILLLCNLHSRLVADLKPCYIAPVSGVVAAIRYLLITCFDSLPA